MRTMVRKNILNFPCRHYINEIILRCVFDTKYGKASDPNISILKSFQNCWLKINSQNYKSGIDDLFIFDKLQN
jgi:hypothetical protein